MAEQQPDPNERLIDIEALFASKNPGLLKIIPGFVLSYLKRIIHQETINNYIYQHRDKQGLAFVEAILKEFRVKVEVADKRTPAERQGTIVPATGRYIVVANHPLGGLDGMALMQELGRIREDIVFPVNELLTHQQTWPEYRQCCHYR